MPDRNPKINRLLIFITVFLCLICGLLFTQSSAGPFGNNYNSGFIRVFSVISYFCSPHLRIIFFIIFLFLSFRFVINIIITSWANTIFLFFIFFNFYPIIEELGIYYL